MKCDSATTQWINTALGGVIAAGAGVVGAVISYKLDRKKRREEQILDATSQWASSYERCISVHNNYCGLVLTLPICDDDVELRKLARQEFVRMSAEAGEAGRTLDAALYRILILVKRPWVRKEVLRLTRQTQQEEIEGNYREVAEEYRKRVPTKRKDLMVFIEKLSRDD